MSDTSTLALPDAARRLGVSVRALRGAIRAGKLPPLPHMTATAAVPAEWLAHVEADSEKSPDALRWSPGQAVPPFARYKGTSAWRKYKSRVREYAQFRAASAVSPTGG